MKNDPGQRETRDAEPTGETREVRSKAERMARARRSKNSAWRSLAHAGILGWLFILPTLLGVFLGRLTAQLTGFRGAVLAGLLIGVVAGGFAVYQHVRRALDDEQTGKE